MVPDAPFPGTTEYFGDSSKVWMINFRVRDLDAMVAQLRAASVSVEVDLQSYPNGRYPACHALQPESRARRLRE
ncbi:MAG: hypothetical protein ABSB35_37920 [Bryobacteraceae bacterium]|jgi:hypothetical protein